MTVRIGIIGVGMVTAQNHVPGLKIDKRCEISVICDPNEELLKQRSKEWGVDNITTDFNEVAQDPNVDAVIVATPNFNHKEITMACIAQGKHVMCEKPLGVTADEAKEMYLAAEEKGVRHMTAFTYRFAPSMRYLRHLLKAGELGTPRHFRSQRFLDWPETSLGWRQSKELAGAGNLYDMTIHRIDFAQDLIGHIKSVSGSLAQFAERKTTADGKECPASEVDDWTAVIGQFEGGCVGVWEGSILMKGHHNDGFGHEWAEINGSKATAVYKLIDPNNLLMGKSGESLKPVPVPKEFLTVPGTPRDPAEGVPSQVFRYDIVYEFVSAIVEKRPAVPGFDHGWKSQRVADAVIKSHETRAWVDIPE